MMFSRQGLFAGTLTLGVSRILAQTLGFLQFMYFLQAYGSNIRVDALFIAQTIPYLFSHFFGQAVTQLMVPVFLHIQERDGQPEAWRFASSLITFNLLLLGGLTVGVTLAAPLVVPLLAPGFGPQERELAVSFLQWMSVLILLNGLCGPARSLYFSHESYAIPALTSMLPSAGIIAGIYFLRDSMGLYAFIVGSIAGAVVQLVLMWAFLNKGERRLLYGLIGWHSGMSEFFGLLAPRFLIIGLNNVNGAIDRAFASGLGPASVSALGYAMTVSDAPTSWLRSTFGGTILPVLSRDAAREDFDMFEQRLQRYLGIAAFLMMPAAVLLIVMAGPLVETLFQRGKFDAEGARLMASAMQYYSIGLVPAGLGAVLAASFLSVKDTWTPFKVSCGLVVVNLVLNYVLVQSMGLRGLALSTSLVLVVRLFAFSAILRTNERLLVPYKTYRSIGKTLLAGLAMAAVLAATGEALGVFSHPTGSFLRRAVPLGLTCGLGGIAYVLMAQLLQISAATESAARIRRMIARRIKPR